MNCPGCGSINYCKDGVIKGRQRYKCKDCGYHYTVVQKSGVKSGETRHLAFEMYLEGLGFRSTGCILKISYGTVFQRVKNWGKNTELPGRNGNVSIVELDEMHTCAGKKTADGYGLLLTDMEKGISLLPVGIGQQKRDYHCGIKSKN
jgi:transposase-like protein